MKFDKVFTVKTAFSKEEFAKKAIEFLAKQKKMPIDIVNAKMNEVELVYGEVLLCRAHVESDYVVLHKLVKLNKHASGEDVQRVVNSAPIEEKRVEGALLTRDINPEQLIEEKLDVEINESALEMAKRRCALTVIFDSKPSDSELVDREDKVEVLELSCCRIPFYVAKMEYNGKSFIIYSTANELSLDTDFEPNENKYLEVNENTLKRVDENSAQIGKIEKITQKAFYGVAAVCFVLGAALHVKWLIVFTLINFVATILLPKLYKKKIQEEIDNCIKEKIAITSKIVKLSSEDKEEIKKEYNQIYDIVFKKSATVFPLNCIVMGLSLIVLAL